MDEKVTVVEKDILDLQPLEMTHDNAKKYWFICCPSCHFPGWLNHTIEEKDEKITILESVLCSCGAHYFVKDSKIIWC